MKAIILGPHPDDEIVGGGAALLNLLDEGYDIEVIILTDGREGYTFNRPLGMLDDDPATEISEEELVTIRAKEFATVMEFVGIPASKRHMLNFPDQGLKNHLREAAEKLKPFIEGADLVVCCSRHEGHVDHAATYEAMALATRELRQAGRLRSTLKFWIYNLYGIIRAPKDKKMRLRLDQHREKLYSAAILYESQKHIKPTWMGYEMLRTTKSMLYGVFTAEDLGKHKNF